MRSFYMVRHGETSTNLKRIATGQMDVSLTENGVNQATDCKRIIHAKGIQPDIIICSGLKRTKETADIINEDLNCPLYQYADLNEQHYGDWEGLSWDIVLPKIEKYGENPPGGESQKTFIDRINRSFTKLLDQYSGTILFITHAGVFKTLFLKYGLNAENVKSGILYELKFSETNLSLLDVIKHESNNL